jgi:hypothetical protein
MCQSILNPESHVATAVAFDLCNKQSYLSHVISCIQVPQVSYTVGQLVFMYNSYVKIACARRVQRRFQHKFQGVTVPHRSTIHTVNKLRQTGSLLDKKMTKSKHWLLIEEKLKISQMPCTEDKGFRIVHMKGRLLCFFIRTSVHKFKISKAITVLCAE